jgi:hypothetical protein
MIEHIQGSSSGVTDSNFKAFALNMKAAVAPKIQGVTFQMITVLRLAVLRI